MTVGGESGAVRIRWLVVLGVVVAVAIAAGLVVRGRGQQHHVPADAKPVLAALVSGDAGRVRSFLSDAAAKAAPGRWLPSHARLTAETATWTERGDSATIVVRLLDGSVHSLQRLHLVRLDGTWRVIFSEPA